MSMAMALTWTHLLVRLFLSVLLFGHSRWCWSTSHRPSLPKTFCRNVSWAAPLSLGVWGPRSNAGLEKGERLAVSAC